MEFKKVCMLGLGYIGLPTAAMLARQGVQVVGVDIDEHVVETLNRGELHIEEPGLAEIVTLVLKSGRLTVSREPQAADAFIIAVPTPFYEDKRADLSAVKSAAEMILPHLQPGNLVVLESTSPPLTTVNLVQPILEGSGLKAGRDFLLAYSPERVLPGQILKELVENARVIGGVDQQSAQAGCDLYSLFVQGEIVLTDASTAEMVKLMENTYRDINIAIANEFSRLAYRFGVNIWEAIGIANKHPRVKILNPGIGVGGHCIGVDPWFFVEAAPDISHLIRTAREVNDAQPHFIFDLIRGNLSEINARRIAVLGLAFKADVDDLRESPAVEIARLLAGTGALVKAYEPYRPLEQVFNLPTAASLEEAIADADVILALVAHRPFKALNPWEVATKTRARLVFDAVGVFSAPEWTQAGFQVVRLGVDPLRSPAPASAV